MAELNACGLFVTNASVNTTYDGHPTVDLEFSGTTEGIAKMADWVMRQAAGVGS